MKLDNQCLFLNHKSNLQERYFGCRVTTTYAGLGWLRQEQKIAESGSASISCQSNMRRWAIFYHLWTHRYETWLMWQPNTMQVWVKVWGILYVGICFSFFREEGWWLEIKLRRNSKLLLSCPRTQRPKVVAKLNPQTFNELDLSLLVCQPWMTRTPL